MDLLELASGRDFPTPQTLDLDLNKDLRAEAARLLPEGPEYIGLAPGSGGPPKCWPLENFIELARHLESQGRVPVFFLGPKETGWIDEIRNALPEARFPLQEEGVERNHGFSPLLSVALSERVRASVSNDSGAAHMFAVGSRPLVIFYGVTAPKKFMPMTDKLTIVRAQDFGGPEMRLIPLDAIEEALEQAIESYP